MESQIPQMHADLHTITLAMSSTLQWQSRKRTRCLESSPGPHPSLRLLLQDLHDSHVCNSLLVAESEEDIWKNETPYTSYRPRATASDDYSADDNYQSRDYLAATMQFMSGHFACEVVWKTIIHIHPRLKMGPNMGVARAIQALRSVLNAFSVVNRKNMFVYQERATKSVFYLRLSETTCSGNTADSDRELQPMLSSRSLALTRSQEPILVDELGSLKPYMDSTPSRSAESSRPIGQVDKHILLMVHGVGQAGPEITDELVKVLRRRLDEATLDIITVMLVRNCKLTPADVEFIQPPGTPPTEVVQFTIPHCCLPWLYAVAHYLRQNLLIFLHTPKYTDSNVEHHFQHYTHGKSVSDADIYLYNKPGGQGTGGKGLETCIERNGFFSAMDLFSLSSSHYMTSNNVILFQYQYKRSLRKCLKLVSISKKAGKLKNSSAGLDFSNSGSGQMIGTSGSLAGNVKQPASKPAAITGITLYRNTCIKKSTKIHLGIHECFPFAIYIVL
ncbi:KICSTOR complex protein SZT2-like [Heterodontus francisci]|uniref:KICSTOR complex protein SZT2-like n=1 Tax=Heterodontus francisci TaxID=7792 RepID=UPI00355AD11E